jgi:signal transduction histidine kinase
MARVRPSSFFVSPETAGSLRAACPPPTTAARACRRAASPSGRRSAPIYASGNHLLSLINDILDLSKIEAGRMELELSDFHLPTAVDSALTLVRERAGRRRIALHTSIDDRLGQIQADERKVRQVVLNLLSNAIKFTPEGGRIEVAATPKDGLVEVSVSDTGVGIALEDQAGVFEEFRQVGTADKKVEGTGLGLTLCRKFVELHGGRIWVKSELGAGSTWLRHSAKQHKRHIFADHRSRLE